MRPFVPLALLTLTAAASAQPLPGGTHLYGELAGATFVGLSLNVEQPVTGPFAVRGGLGFMPELFGNDLQPTFIGGLVAVPGSGSYRPELAVTATAIRDEAWRALFGPYLGVRYHAQNGSIMRLGVHLLLMPEGDGRWVGGPWPALSFGGRL